jgi:hypothetical protein
MGAPFMTGLMVEHQSSHAAGRPPFPRFAPFTHATAALGRARLSTAYVSSAYTAQAGGCLFGEFVSHAASLAAALFFVLFSLYVGVRVFRTATDKP